MLIPASSFVSSFHGGLAPGPTAVSLSSVALASGCGGSFMQMSVITKSVVTSIAIPAALSIVGGGGGSVPEVFSKAATSKLDINRVKMRLEGLQAYGTICALLMNATLRLFSSTPTNPEDGSKNYTKDEALAMDVFATCAVISVLFGSYTTVVFSLMALYSKRALGQGLDQQFLDFFAATESLRDSGIRSFLYSLVSFEGAFILSLFLKHSNKRRWRLVGTASLISFISFWRWSNVLRLAAKLLGFE